MSTINLQKGQNIDLTKTNPGLKKIRVGLGWDINSSSTGADFDLDASVFILGEDDKLLSDKHFVFYNNLKSPNDSTVHAGDNRTGEGDGDDESIIVDLSKIEPNASKLVFIVTIHEADSRNQNFGQVNNSYVRLLNEENNEELAKYELGEDFSVEKAVDFIELYKKDGEWKLKAIGTGSSEGLQHYVNKYQK